MNKVWNKLLEFETRDLVSRHIDKKYNRKASAKQILEITSNFVQAREYFKNAKNADFSIKPLLQYYGVMSLAKGFVLVSAPEISESSLKKSHGLATKGWQEDLSNKSFGDLRVEITDGGFYELLIISENKSYFKHHSNGLSWKLKYDFPKKNIQFTFKDLIKTISDLSEEYEIWAEKELNYFSLEKFTPIPDKGVNEFVVRSKSENLKNLYKIFSNEFFENISIEGNKIRASNDNLPQFSQSFVDVFNTGIGEIVLTKPIAKNLHLNTLAQFYALSYYMGMLCRYFPSTWLSIRRAEKGDAIYPLLYKSLKFVEDFYPLTILEYLNGPYDFE